jgi:hypothetical protein
LQLGILRRAVGVGDLPEGSGLGRRRFGIKGGEVEAGQIRGDLLRLMVKLGLKPEQVK